MPKACIICGKKVVSGNNVSHSHHKTKRIFKPNLQKIRILLNGKRIRAYVCASCLQKNKVVKI